MNKEVYDSDEESQQHNENEEDYEEIYNYVIVNSSINNNSRLCMKRVYLSSIIEMYKWHRYAGAEKTASKYMDSKGMNALEIESLKYQLDKLKNQHNELILENERLKNCLDFSLTSINEWYELKKEYDVIKAFRENIIVSITFKNGINTILDKSTADIEKYLIDDNLIVDNLIDDNLIKSSNRKYDVQLIVKFVYTWFYKAYYEILMFERDELHKENNEIKKMYNSTCSSQSIERHFLYDFKDAVHNSYKKWDELNKKYVACQKLLNKFHSIILSSDSNQINNNVLNSVRSYLDDKASTIIELYNDKYEKFNNSFRSMSFLNLLNWNYNRIFFIEMIYYYFKMKKIKAERNIVLEKNRTLKNA